MILLSIIIPVYNVDKYLNECLDSILVQNNKDIEIILIDDGSTDNSAKICQKYEQLYSNIKYIQNKNHGVSYTRNCGIKHSTGKYILFVDSDDKISVHGLDILREKIKTNQDLYIYSYKQFYKNMDKNYIFTSKKITKNQALRDLMDEDKFCGYVWNKVFSSEIVKKII